MLKIRNLTKRYKEKLAVDDFSMEAHEQSIVALLGPNGSGKTTVLNCVLTLLRYNKGSIEVFGREFKSSDYDIKARIGLVPQEVSVFSELNVRENIDYFCGLYIKNSRTRKQLVDEAVEFVGLEQYLKYPLKKLSGGLKRRLNIACGVAHKPELIFLDEPTVAVDAQSRNFILEGVKKLRDNGATIIYTTHYLEEVENFADNIYIMDKGRNLASGSLQELRGISSISESIELDLEHGSPNFKQMLSSLEGILEIEKSKDNYQLKFGKTEGSESNTSVLLRFIEEQSIPYISLSSRKPTLNDIFLELTGKELRD